MVQATIRNIVYGSIYIILATFGVQKLRGKSTKRALRDAAIVGGGSYALGQTAFERNMGIGQGPAFSSLGFGQRKDLLIKRLPFEATQGAQFRPGYQAILHKEQQKGAKKIQR